jgi:hypothetical protein
MSDMNKALAGERSLVKALKRGVRAIWLSNSRPKISSRTVKVSIWWS